jgi:hypothetical protein
LMVRMNGLSTGDSAFNVETGGERGEGCGIGKSSCGLQALGVG